MRRRDADSAQRRGIAPSGTPRGHRSMTRRRGTRRLDVSRGSRPRRGMTWRRAAGSPGARDGMARSSAAGSPSARGGMARSRAPPRSARSRRRRVLLRTESLALICGHGSSYVPRSSHQYRRYVPGRVHRAGEALPNQDLQQASCACSQLRSCSLSTTQCPVTGSACVKLSGSNPSMNLSRPKLAGIATGYTPVKQAVQ